jgi:hypothetical protein
MLVSLTIASRNEFHNLKWTLQSALDKLWPAYEGDFEIIVGLNMPTDEEADYIRKLSWTQQGVVQLVVHDEPSAWQTRRKCAQQARGKYIFWMDSHVVLRGNDLMAAAQWHRGWKGTLKFGLNYFLDKPERTSFQYNWKPERFWGTWSRRKPTPPHYRILLSGSHGLVDREVYEAIGGIHPALGIYGGGEPYLDLLQQMYGYEIRCHPEFQVWHLAEKRGYSWNNDDLWRNFMIAAYALGGAKWLDLLYSRYVQRCNGVERYLTRLVELRDEAVTLATAARERIAAEASFTLDEVLERWEAEYGN